MTDEEFRAFYAETAPALHAYLARAARDDALADDLLQGAYVRFLRSRSGLRDARARRTYLFRIATNLLRDESRRQTARDRRHAAAAAEGLAAEARSDRAEAASNEVGLSLEAALEVRRALDEVSARDRELLWLAYVNGMTHREVAAATGVAAASVRVLLARARQRLARVLEARGVGAEDLV